MAKLPSIRSGLAELDRQLAAWLGILNPILSRASEAEPWRAPAFVNGWAGLPALAPAFQREAGEVRLRGAIAGGVSGTVAFVLPSGYRPAATAFFPIIMSGGGAAMASIDAAGQVTVTGASVSTAAHLDAISFRAEG